MDSVAASRHQRLRWHAGLSQGRLRGAWEQLGSWAGWLGWVQRSDRTKNAVQQGCRECAAVLS